MLKLANIRDGMRIIDLGGTEKFWAPIKLDLKVTVVNLPPRGAPRKSDTASLTYVYEDACDLRHLFADGSFDFVFSNSTIEHVGDESRQEQFAREAKRLAPAHWVQTPSDRFPIEAHCLVPYYWSYPQGVRDRLMKSWMKRLPVWAEMMNDTRVLSRARMAELFPDDLCFTERLGGLEKSYAFYKPAVPV
jgi:hypothetical protein